MPTPFESATLILTLYDQRREETMRKARDFFVTFDPQSFEEYVAGMFGPQGGYVRMVVSYWDLAASLVNNGAIDEKMFRDANGEYVLVFAKLEPFLPQLREMFGNPGFAEHLEKFTLGMPNARERLDSTVQRIRALIAKSRAASAD
jgi:hypothetical protein